MSNKSDININKSLLMYILYYNTKLILLPWQADKLTIRQSYKHTNIQTYNQTLKTKQIGQKIQLNPQNNKSQRISS